VLRTRYVASIWLLLAAGCGPGPGTHATVDFDNGTAEGAGPSLFEMTLVKIALLGSDGQTVIYRNPECDPLAGCEAPEHYDFAERDPDIDARERNIDTGRYHRVEVSLCSTAGVPTVRWQGGAMTAPREYVRDCVVSMPLAGSVLVEAGNQLDVTLAYDAAPTLMTGLGATGEDCDESAVPRVCFSVPVLQPSIDVTIVVE